MFRHFRIILSLAVLALFALTLAGCAGSNNGNKATGKADKFLIGADISEVPAMEARGISYTDAQGKEEDPLKLMAANGFDIIRLRIFVNPEAENGYSKDGFCGTESTMAFARRIIDAGMQFALDFHYSDTWADPDKQYKPSAWEGLSGKALEDKLYEYTKDVLTQLKDAGLAPSVVQVGNEINHGLVWPEGFIGDNATEDNWAAAMGLYAAGAKAVSEVLPKSKLQVHLALGGENRLCHEFLDQMKKYGAKFDIIGLSYYERWHETYDDLKSNLDDLAACYKVPVCVCEYGANKDNIRIINDIVRSVPKSRGFGTMAWAPSNVLFGGGQSPYRQFNHHLAMNEEIFDIYRQIDDDYASGIIPEVKAPYDREAHAQNLIKEKIVGADISWASQEIMMDKGFNYFRLNLFVSPDKAYCGIDQTIALAKRIKSAGMKFLLNFHYSDTWADPENQQKPSAWERYSGSGLEGQIYNYTMETLKQFIAEGVKPDMVQVGNEINHGMVWPQGKIGDSYLSFLVMCRCACAAVRATDPTISIMLNIACGDQNAESREFFDRVLARDIKFDVIGESYYPECNGSLENLKSNLTDLAKRYGKPIVVIQHQENREEVNEIVNGLPHGLGLGTFIRSTPNVDGDLTIFDTLG